MASVSDDSEDLRFEVAKIVRDQSDGIGFVEARFGGGADDEE